MFNWMEIFNEVRKKAIINEIDVEKRINLLSKMQLFFAYKTMGAGQGRPLRNCPVGNFREEPDCRGGSAGRRAKKR